MSRKRLSKVIIFLGLFISLFLVVISNTREVEAGTVDCTALGRYCAVPGSTIDAGVGNYYWFVNGYGGCGVFRIRNWSCTGSDSACVESNTTTYYLTEDDCRNRVNSYYTGCCNLNPPPNPCKECTLGDCPAPLTNTGDSAFKFANYRECDNENCDDDKKYGDCYEPTGTSTKPTSSLVILRDVNEMTSMGCVSSTNTGSEINNPIQMRSTHIDADSSDIEALYIWLKTDTLIPGTPEYIDINSNSGQTGKTYTRNSYGFMMHKEGSSWVPYIPSLVGSGNDKWIKANYSSSRFPILGPDGQTLVNVEIHSVSGPGNNITMEFSLDYTGAISNDALRVLDGSYNIFVMANDVFGFTPYDNYGPAVTKIGDYFNDEQIRYYRSWTDSGRDWSFDFTSPEVNSFASEVTGPINIKLNWNVGDLRGLYAIVNNIYVSEGVEETDDITVDEFISAGTKTIVNPYSPAQQGISVIGNLAGGYIAKAINIRGINQVGSLEMNVGANREGSLMSHVTVFDLACNYNQSYSSYNLEDWIVTYGGLVYSSGGIDFPVKDLTNPDLWTPVDLLNKLKPLYADISSEMYADSSGTPSSLKKSSDTKSFSISPFKEYKIDDYYNDVRNTFERREIGILNVETMPDTISSLVGNLNAGGNIKVLDRIGDLTVGNENPFICDGKGVFFVSRDLIIDNEILNVNASKDACIFVVNGNVTINAGPNSSAGSIGYDEINAYILTNGTVTISEDTFLDGLYINGGIQSKGGINTINRYLGLNYRNTHPVIVVNHHSKYGIFSSTLIGNPVDMVKIEVGFKPY